MCWVLTPIIRSLYDCKCSFWYRLTRSPTKQQEQMVVDPVNQYQRLYLQLYQLLMMGVNTQHM